MAIKDKADKKVNDKVVEIIYQDLVEKLNPKVNATPGRKRPRNPQERETLLRWERERGGKKIGEI